MRNVTQLNTLNYFIFQAILKFEVKEKKMNDWYFIETTTIKKIEEIEENYYYLKKQNTIFIKRVNRDPTVNRSKRTSLNRLHYSEVSIFIQHLLDLSIRRSNGFFCLLICRVASDGALNFLNYSRKAFSIPFSTLSISIVIETNFRI